MEPSVQVMAKKLWHMVRVVYFMLKKGISKGKLMMDLKLMMFKRNKLNGKSIRNLLFHNNKVHNHLSSAFSAITSAAQRRSHDENQELFQYCNQHDEYEFSWSNSREPNRHQEDEFMVHAVALGMLNSGASSPTLPGFGKSPMVRQLRITDSPFTLKDVDEDSHIVDEAAEEFIEKFYKDLRRQNSTAA